MNDRGWQGNAIEGRESGEYVGTFTIGAAFDGDRHAIDNVRVIFSHHKPTLIWDSTIPQ